MFTKKMFVLLGVLVLAAVVVTACGTAGPAGPAGPAGAEGPAGPAGAAGESAVAADLTCTECHNDTAIITGQKAAWVTSVHGTGAGLAYAGERKDCAGCHDGSAFSMMIAEDKNFTQIEAPNQSATHQDCRTCHQIHTTYTGADWALETNAPVTFVASGLVYDGGAGNLCANCHQARRYLAGFAAKDSAGVVIPDKFQTSVRFNTHYSVQGDVLMGGGDFGVEGKPGGHYSLVENTCVGCHMGDGQDHNFKPQVAACVACHTDAENFDVNGYVTAFKEKYAELEAKLLEKGLISKNDDGTFATVTKNADGTPVILDPGPAQALFFYHLVHEDSSDGIHNPNYFNALMENALAVLE